MSATDWCLFLIVCSLTIWSHKSSISSLIFLIYFCLSIPWRPKVCVLFNFYFWEQLPLIDLLLSRAYSIHLRSFWYLWSTCCSIHPESLSINSLFFPSLLSNFNLAKNLDCSTIFLCLFLLISFIGQNLKMRSGSLLEDPLRFYSPFPLPPIVCWRSVSSLYILAFLLKFCCILETFSSITR